MNGEILGGAKPREAADRERRNSRARRTNSQREKNPKAGRRVRRSERFGRIMRRNSKRVEAVAGAFRRMRSAALSPKAKAGRVQVRGKGFAGETPNAVVPGNRDMGRAS